MSTKPIVQFIEKPMSGEWGVEPTNGHSIGVIRNANFTNEGVMDLSDIAYRDIPEKKIKQKALKHGDIIIEKSGGSPTQPVGRVVYYDRADGELMFSNFTATLRPRPGVDSRYLFFMLWATHLFKKTSAYQNKTTGIANLQLERYINEVELPDAPLPEQRRIAAILDKAQALVANDKRTLAVYDQLAKSLFLEMFGDPVRNERGWEVVKLKSCYEGDEATRCGPFGSALKKGEYVDEGVPVWTMDNIVGFSFDPSACLYITSEKYADLTHYAVKDGDIIISRAGTVGKMCVLKSGHAHSIISTNLIKLSLDKSKLLPEVFVRLMTYFRGRVGNLRTGKEGAFTHMNTQVLDNLAIALPPLPVQNEYVRSIEAINLRRAQVEQSLLQSEGLFGSLLQGAFAGGLGG